MTQWAPHTLQRDHAPLLCSVLTLGCCSQAALCPVILYFISQCSGWSKKAVGLFDRVLYSWGSQVLTHVLSLSPMGEILGQEKPYWQWALLPWGRSNEGKVKLCLSFSLVFPISHFVSALDGWNVTTNSWTSTKALLSMGDSLNSCCVCVEGGGEGEKVENVRKRLFAMIMTLPF